MAALSWTNAHRSVFAVWRWQRPRLIAILLVVFVLAYPMSFGPACWFAAWSRSPKICGVVSLIYKPVAISVVRGPLWYSTLMRSHIHSGLPKGVTLENESNGIFLSFPFDGFTYTVLSM